MRISACWITRNEAENIEASMASVAKSVDEIVVLDTGSADDTCRIVQAFPGARLFHGEWRDDFAAARNEALSHATGDWVVFLDADERFSEETQENLRPVIERCEDHDALAVKILNLDIDGAETKCLDHTYVVRAFRRMPEIRYVGRIHEQIERRGEELRLGFVPEKTLVLLHTGYTASRTEKKAERNLRLLLRELEQTEKPQELYR